VPTRQEMKKTFAQFIFILLILLSASIGAAKKRENKHQKMEAFGLPRMKGPRLTVWRSSFAHPRSTHIQTVHTHWFNYKVRIRSC
jgi:hypothetical protein